ncbi:hypothetical protein TorRG33x02_011470, partial [Trema orientale]
MKSLFIFLISPSVSSNRPPRGLCHQLLLLSPLSLRRSKTHLANRLEIAEEPVEPIGSRWQCKSRISQLGLLDSSSPRNTRKSRRRSEIEVKEEKDLGFIEDIEKPRKMHHIIR